MQTTSFNEAVELQRIDKHLEYLKKRGYSSLEDRTKDKSIEPKLHDLYDPKSKTWIECKRDSYGIDRLLIEYKANIYISDIRRMGLADIQHEAINYKLIADRVNALPSKHNALATDTQHLEARHLVSFWLETPDKHFLFDLRQLQALVAQRQYRLMVVGYDGEDWRTIGSLMPIADAVALDAQTRAALGSEPH